MGLIFYDSFDYDYDMKFWPNYKDAKVKITPNYWRDRDVESPKVEVSYVSGVGQGAHQGEVLVVQEVKKSQRTINTYTGYTTYDPHGFGQQYREPQILLVVEGESGQLFVRSQIASIYLSKDNMKELIQMLEKALEDMEC